MRTRTHFRSLVSVLFVSVLGLSLGASSAQAINVITDSQVVTGTQCVGGACSTDTPVEKGIEVHTGDTPLLRLNQAAGGFTSQIWDVAGNEANFFIRDFTSGSKLPFRIFPTTPTNTLTLKPQGIGIGTNNPTSLLELSRDEARIEIEDTSESAGPRVLADLVANGAPLIRLKDSTPGSTSWQLGAGGSGAFTVRDDDAAPTAPDALAVTPAGTATVPGVLQQGADSAVITDPQPVDQAMVLAKLKALPISSWKTSADATGARHIGPSGGEFRAAFGVGSSDKVVAPADLASVGMVAIKQLAQNDESADQRVLQLESITRSQDAKLKAMSKKQGQTAKQLKRLKRQVKALLKRK